MQQTVTTLILFFVALSINACSQKLMMVPIACKIPIIIKMEVSNTDENTTLREAKQCVSNYYKVKQNYDILSEAIKICQ